jgi:putative peptidoglycan lipid II flippase
MRLQQRQQRYVRETHPFVAARAQDFTQFTGSMNALRPTNIAWAAIILMISTVVSRLLGILRTSLFSYAFGATFASFAYFQAFQIPDTIFNLVAGGALTSAFIPIFSEYLLDKRDKKTAWHIASAALNLSVICLAILAGLAFLGAPYIVPLYTPGYPANSPQMHLIVTLTRLMLLQPIALGASTMATAILNARQHFLLPAIGQVLYNVGIIGGITATIVTAHLLQPDAHSGMYGPPPLGIYGPTLGVVAGALLLLLVQIPGLFQQRMPYRLTFDFRHPGVRAVGRLMVPRVINAAMVYVSFGVTRALASLLGAQQASDYFYAFTVMMLPLGIFGMAVSTAAFPTMAAQYAIGRMNELRNTFLRMLRSILYLSIPSSFLMMVLAVPIIQLLMQHGHFTAQDTTYTAAVLIFFAIGLTGLAAVEILVRSFYAMQDSRTPVYVSLVQFVFAIALSLVLVNPLGIYGLALASSVASTLEAITLFALIRTRMDYFDLHPLMGFLARVCIASLATAVLSGALFYLINIALPITELGWAAIGLELIKLISAALPGIAFYAWLSWVFRLEEMQVVERILIRLHLKRAGT